MVNKKALVEASRRWRAKYPERSRAAGRKWYAKNRDRVRERYNSYRLRTLPEHARRSAKRRTGIAMATPWWANPVAMDYFYCLAASATKSTGIPHQVDHVVPIKHPLVCGLHHELNLRVIPAKQNISKGNRFWPDMP